jgi:hypothetical protein
MAQLVETLVAYYLEQQRAWPALPTDRSEGLNWDRTRAYQVYAQELLKNTLLCRGPHVLQARLALQKARAMHTAGLAHGFRVSLFCIEMFEYARSAWDVRGPCRALGHRGGEWYPTRAEMNEVLLHAGILHEERDMEDDF